MNIYQADGSFVIEDFCFKVPTVKGFKEQDESDTQFFYFSLTNMIAVTISETKIKNKVVKVVPIKIKNGEVYMKYPWKNGKWEIAGPITQQIYQITILERELEKV